jgi:hypothetical protein
VRQPDGDRVAPHLDRVPPPDRPGLNQRQGPLARGPARARVGLRLLRGQSTGGRAHPTTAHEDRARPRTRSTSSRCEEPGTSWSSNASTESSTSPPRHLRTGRLHPQCSSRPHLHRGQAHPDLDQQQTDLRQSLRERRAGAQHALHVAPGTLNLSTRSRRPPTSNVLIQTHGQWLSRARTAPRPSTSRRRSVRGRRGTRHRTDPDAGGQGSSSSSACRSPRSRPRSSRSSNSTAWNTRCRCSRSCSDSARLFTSIVGMSGGIWVTRRTVRPLERGLGRGRPDRRRRTHDPAAGQPRRPRGPATHGVLQRW